VETAGGSGTDVTGSGSGGTAGAVNPGSGGNSNGTAGVNNTGSGGTAGGGTGGAKPMDASVMIPVTDAAGPLSDSMAPRYGDGSIAAVAATPPAQWVNVTANLAGMASECGNTSHLSSHPSRDMIIVSVAKKGLWATTDGGTSWHQLGTGGGSVITNRGSSMVFDPVNPDVFWESGIYNDKGVYKTTDNGNIFAALGDAHHNDSVSVDLSDPQRQTLLAGGHEQKQTVYRSANGGTTWTNVGTNLPIGTNFCTTTLVLDKMIHLVGCSGYAGGTDGVFRTTDGGTTWAHTSAQPAAENPLWASDGTIYWSLIYDHGLMKSTDQGNTWTATIGGNTVKTSHPIELPDGRIVMVGPNTLMISSDHGAHFTPVGTKPPFVPASVSYSPYRNAFYIRNWDCKDLVLPNAIMQFGFDYRTQ
jgi:hypothetical protein